VAERFDLDAGAVVQPELRLGLRRELADNGATSSAQLVSATSAGNLTAQGPAQGRTIGDFGARVTLRLPRAIDLYAGIDARISGGESNETVGLGLRMLF